MTVRTRLFSRREQTREAITAACDGGGHARCSGHALTLYAASYGAPCGCECHGRSFETWAAGLLMAEYDRALAALGSGTAVHAALGLEPGEAFELAHAGFSGALRVVQRRAARL